MKTFYETQTKRMMDTSIGFDPCYPLLMLNIPTKYPWIPKINPVQFRLCYPLVMLNILFDILNIPR